MVAAGLLRFPFFIQHHEQIRQTTYHSQPGVEIDIIHEGRGTFTIGVSNQVLVPRQVVVFSGELPHKLLADPGTPYRRTVICIEPARLGLGSSVLMPLVRANAAPWILESSAYREIERLCSWLDRELREERSGWETSAGGILAHLLVLLQRSAEAIVGRQSSGPGSQGPGDLVEACRQYIRDHLDEPIGLSSLAEHFFVSAGHLSRQFRRKLGMTVHEYLLSERLNEAKRLLVTRKDLPVTEIALRVGFPSLSHFIRTFRRHVGRPPRSYRKLVEHA